MKVVLTIAGSDSGGGAGIQADIKTFEAFGIFSTTAITVLTAQNTLGVDDIFEVSAEFLRSQLRAIFNDFKIDAIKIGMLYSNEIIEVVKDEIKNLDIPIIIDPVCVAKSGAKLLNLDAIQNLKTLFPYATIVTPNLFEAKVLFGYKFGDSDSLNEIINAPYHILIKNDILEMNEQLFSIDTLYHGRDKLVFKSPLIATPNKNGTGCSFSSAICANLALGKSLPDAIEIAKKFISFGIENAQDIGHGAKPIAHKKAGEMLHFNNENYLLKENK